jgi:hypothetical protein
MQEIKTIIKKYDGYYKDNVISLLKFQYPHLSINERYDLFSWRYENNPYIKSPLIYLAIYNENVIGIRAYVIQKFICQDNEFNIASAADAVIHPSFRKRGIFSTLNHFSINDIKNNYNNYKIPIILNLSSNEISTHVNLKYGWRPIGFKSNIVKYSLFNMFIRLFINNSVQNNYIIHCEKYKVIVSKNILIDQLVNLSMRQYPSRRITNKRDELYYKWRYNFQRYRYHYVYCYDKESLVGYLIIKHLSSLKYSMEEYFYDSIDCFASMVRAAFKTIKIPAIKIFNLSITDEERSHLSSLGFKKQNKLLLRIRKTPRLPGLIKVINSELHNYKKDYDDIELMDPYNWKIYAADIH